MSQRRWHGDCKELGVQVSSPGGCGIADLWHGDCMGYV